jgi:hypothetical protein
MELRPKGYGIGSTVFMLGGVWILVGTRPDTVMNVLAMALAPIAVIGGAWLTFERLRPFRFHIGPQGLTLRTRGVNRLVRWSEIHAVVLTGEIEIRNGRPHMTARLLLVPASAGFEARLDQLSPVDARPCLELLDLEDVREKPADVVDALSRSGGERFLDARLAATQAVGPVIPVRLPSFAITWRGYDRTVVDTLILFAQSGIGDPDGPNRMQAKAQLEARMAKGLPRALRGYDRARVDAVLKLVSERLAQGH